MTSRMRSSQTRRTDGKGGVEGLRKRLLDLGLASVKVGVPGDAKESETSESLAMIARVHEFGNPARGIPERSFLRGSILFNRKKYVNAAKVLSKRALDGRATADQVYGTLGQLASGDVKEYIRNADFPALKPATIRRKGSSKPLIDTGQLRQSITYIVVED